MEIAWTICCWSIAAIAFLFFGLCLYVTVGIALRFVFTGKTGSGLPIVGSIVATGGILIAPVEKIADRLPWTWVPIAFEATVLVLLYIIVWIGGRKMPNPPEKSQSATHDPDHSPNAR